MWFFLVELRIEPRDLHVVGQAVPKMYFPETLSPFSGKQLWECTATHRSSLELFTADKK